MKCCGKERDTYFCPDCGKRLRDEVGPRGLLRYIRAQRRAQETRYKNLCIDVGLQTDTQEKARWIRRRDRALQCLERWQSWERFVREGIEAKEVDQPSA